MAATAPAKRGELAREAIAERKPAGSGSRAGRRSWNRFSSSACAYNLSFSQFATYSFIWAHDGLMNHFDRAREAFSGGERHG